MQATSRTILVLMISLTFGAAASAASLTELAETRIAGDRSDLCLVVSRVGPAVEHASACANPASQRALGADALFEIGSVSKAMLGLLIAVLIEEGDLELDQPLIELLPAARDLSNADGEPVRLRHLLTHTAGLPRLPPGFAPSDNDNPYADLRPSDLLASLANTELKTPPGQAFEYSNFGAMLLSLALAEHTGTPLAQLFEQHVFAPLGMDETSMTGATVQGHDANGSPVPNWDFDGDLGGVGAVRSTPHDMARWLGALLDPDSTSMASALKRSMTLLGEASGSQLGYGWIHLPLNDRQVLAHDGGTGGFSTFAAVDPERGRAALVLMDTSMVLEGSLGDLALHLLDDSVPLGQPRQPAAVPDGEVLADYEGRFDLYDGDEAFMGDFNLEFSVRGDELYVQARVGEQVQPQIPMLAKGEGRFVQEALDLDIRFVREDSGQIETLAFRQGTLELRGLRR